MVSCSSKAMRHALTCKSVDILYRSLEPHLVTDLWLREKSRRVERFGGEARPCEQRHRHLSSCLLQTFALQRLSPSAYIQGPSICLDSNTAGIFSQCTTWMLRKVEAAYAPACTAIPFRSYIQSILHFPASYRFSCWHQLPEVIHIVCLWMETPVFEMVVLEYI
jgi:hypothetical protein